MKGLAKIKDPFMGFRSSHVCYQSTFNKVKSHEIINGVMSINLEGGYQVQNMTFDKRKYYIAKVFELNETPFIGLLIKRKGWYCSIYNSWEYMLETWDILLDRSVLVEKIQCSGIDNVHRPATLNMI